MIPNRKKILIVIALTILVVAILSGALALFMTDPTPPQIRAGWYLPDQDIVWTKPGSSTNPSEHLVLTGKFNGPAPQFPGLSPYCRYVNYTHETTGQKYMIAVWYFNDDGKFLEAQRQLKEYLVTSGTCRNVALNFSGSLTTGLSSIPGQDSYDNDLLPASLMTTGYESADTSGLLFTVELPGSGIESNGRHSLGNNEHYIVYYGTVEPATLASRVDFLTGIIGRTYAFDRVIAAGPLVS